jgi:hypothetical protein
MSTTTKKAPQTSPRRPEKKWGPFAGGVGVAIWLNEVETPEGRKFFRTLTIAPRRYKNAESGEWMNSPGFRPQDLSAIILGLQAALDFIASTPLPGQAAEEEPHDVPPPSDSNGDIPY